MFNFRRRWHRLVIVQSGALTARVRNEDEDENENEGDDSNRKLLAHL